MLKQNYYTPSELIEMYPKVLKLGWNPVKVGIFFSSGLLEGYCAIRERRSMILESSFVELMNYANSITKKKLLD